MSYLTCDTCDTDTYTEDNPFVEVRMPRPSDKTDMSCILAGHKVCMGETGINPKGGVATPEEWQMWIEGEGAKLGFLFLS